MDYNSLITTDLAPLVEKTLRMVDKFSNYYKIEDLKVSIDDSDLSDLGSYVSTFSTCEFSVDVQYRVTGETEYRYMSFSVPRMIDGIFIIRGKYKMISRYLAEDYSCRRIGDYFRISYNFSYDINEQKFGVYDSDAEEFVQLTFDEVQEEYPELLQLNEHQGNKLKIQLDLNYTPSRITKELTDMFSRTVDNKYDIINKRIISVEGILFSSLRQNMLNIVKGLSHNFYNTGTLASAPFQKIIDGVFYNRSESLNSTINSTNVNPLSFDSTNQKIIIDNEVHKPLRPGNYDSSMADIIDPLMTPDNANINRINMLNRSTTFKDGALAIRCYDAKFNPVVVNYIKYLASTVLSSDEVKDYDARIIETKELYHCIRNRKGVESKTFDYIEASPDDRLSVVTRMIPMVNMVDSVRGAMAAKMVGQAVPLANPEAPRVQSGYESDYELSTTDVKFESTMQGKVIKSDYNSVVVDVNGIPKEYKVPSPAVGIYDITAVFSPKVKVGDIVNKGDTLITHDISKTGTRNLGVNALVSMRPYRGLNYEDGLVISQSFAEKLTHYSIIDLTLNIRDDESIVSILPIGSRVQSKDIIVNCITRFKSTTTDKLIGIMTPEDKSVVRSNNLVTPNSIDRGYITDLQIYYNDYAYTDGRGNEHNKINEASLKLIEKYKRNKIVLPEIIPKEYQARLPEGIDYEGYAACIRVRILTFNPATVGSKCANFYGSKGLVAAVLPDSEMDRTADGRVADMIINSDAVIARKNIAQIPALNLVKIADAVKEKVKDMDIIEAKIILAKYKLTNYSRMKNEDLEAYLKSDKPLYYITGCYSRISIKEILEWMKELGIEELTHIIDGKTNRPVRNPVYFGNMYMMKLYQLPEHYNKVHAEGSDSDPILGKGLYREESGQSQGGLETYALMSSDLTPYIEQTRNSYKFRDAESILINLRLAGVDLGLIKDDDE